MFVVYRSWNELAEERGRTTRKIVNYKAEKGTGVLALWWCNWHTSFHLDWLRVNPFRGVGGAMLVTLFTLLTGALAVQNDTASSPVLSYVRVDFI